MYRTVQRPSLTGSGWPWWINVLLFAAACLCLSAVAAAVWMGLEERQKKRARQGNLRQAWNTPGQERVGPSCKMSHVQAHSSGNPKAHGYSPAAHHSGGSRHETWQPNLSSAAWGCGPIARQPNQEATQSFMQNIHMPQMPWQSGTQYFNAPTACSQSGLKFLKPYLTRVGGLPPTMHLNPEAHRQTRGGRYFHS